MAGVMLTSVLGAAAAGSKQLTVKQHDLAEVQKLSSSVLFELLAASFMHFVSKSTAPLLMLPMMGLSSKLKAPIVQIHLLRMKPVGQLARPFKSGLEAMLSSFGKAGGLGKTMRGADAVVTPLPEAPASIKTTSTDSTHSSRSAEDDGDVIDLDSGATGGEASPAPASAQINSDKGRAKGSKRSAGSSTVKQKQSKHMHIAEQMPQEVGEDSQGVSQGAEGELDSAELLEAIDRLGELELGAE
jgi:hypothetical protein